MILVVLIIIVVVCIGIVGSYIPYRRFKKRSTETANFSFVDLKKPSRFNSFRIQIDRLKEKVTKKKSKVGLVNYNTDDSVDSFYGSLNPFAAHETL